MGKIQAIGLLTNMIRYFMKKLKKTNLIISSASDSYTGGFFIKIKWYKLGLFKSAKQIRKTG